jgi:hypothetical protein
MKTLGALLLVAAGLAASVSVARPASTDGSLQANVGPGFAITLTQNGTKVTHLDPGTYTIDVVDQATEHDFHLFGPGVNETTDIGGTGTTTWTVTFQDGATYDYVCDAHVGTMHGRFTVGTVAPTTTTTAAAPLSLKIVAAKVVKPKTVRLSVRANRATTVTATLWKGKTRLAHAKARGTSTTISLVAGTALKKGAYTAKVVSGSASASRTVTVR